MLLAGAATIDITPGHPVLMDGYGGRREPSQGVHDPLFGRALVFDDGTTQAVIVSTDLLGVHPEVARELRARAQRETGIDGDHLLLCATHDHAAPAGLRGGMFAQLNADLAAVLVDRLAGAVAEAWGARRPAVLKSGRATIDTISMNRRDPEWPLDPELRVVLVDGEDGGGPIATLLNFACHATVLSGANLLLSAEFPGEACRLLQAETGAPAVYLNGACGNVNPTWIRQDFESVRRAGHVVGGAALRLVAEMRALGPGQRAHNIRWDEFPEKATSGRLIEPRLRVARREIDLPLRDFGEDGEYAARIEALEREAAALPPGGQHRAVMAQLSRYQSERWAAMWARRQQEKTTQRTEVQAISLGDGLAVLALPGEFFAWTGALIRERGGIEELLIACYANDYIGYVIPADAYEQGGYESGVTFTAPEGESIIVDTSVKLLREASGHGV